MGKRAHGICLPLSLKVYIFSWGQWVREEKHESAVGGGCTLRRGSHEGSPGLRSEFCALMKANRHLLGMTSLSCERTSEPFQFPYLPSSVFSEEKLPNRVAEGKRGLWRMGPLQSQAGGRNDEGIPQLRTELLSYTLCLSPFLVPSTPSLYTWAPGSLAIHYYFIHIDNWTCCCRESKETDSKLLHEGALLHQCH